jgi:hypothetical protein
VTHLEPAKARCDVYPLTGLDGQPAKTLDGRQWYGCTACERSFTEAHPTIVPAICLKAASS